MLPMRVTSIALAVLLAGCDGGAKLQPDVGVEAPDSGQALPDASQLLPDASAPGGDAGLAVTPSDCLSRTKNEAECKDCCDCLGTACGTIVACRDECPLHDFSKNSQFISVTVPSVLGAAGDYSACTSAATEAECKACCDCDSRFVCGDQRFCRDACIGPASAWPPLKMTEVGAPQLVKDTFTFAEGPAWDASAGQLFFSDIDADTLYRYTPGGAVAVFRNPSSKANGLAFDTAGRLLAAEHGSRSVTRTLADGTVQTVASSYQGKRLNSPNDLVVRSDGTIYFTDPTYGLGSQASELGYTGLFRISTDGVLHLEAKIDGAPNGVDLAPGEKTLYVAATTAGKIHSYTVATDGSLTYAKPFATIDSPDGMAVDAGGNLYVAALEGGKGAVVVLNREGKRLGALALDQQPTNCGFGGSDLKSLYITARKALYVVAVPIPGNKEKSR